MEYAASKIQSVETANSIAFVTMAENGAIDEVTATEHIEIFNPWVAWNAYAVGNLRNHNGILYKCVQAHTAQEGWEPDKTPALWVVAGDPAVEWKPWSQPIGAQDAYANGDKVEHNGKHWVSSVDSNVWEPGVYGWDEAEN